MKLFKRIIAAVLALAMLNIFATLCVLASEQESTPKEEAIYVSLNHDGSVEEIYVVNIFELTEDGKIVDYGEYEAVRNMTTTDKLDYSGACVTVDAAAGRLYYEGKLKSQVIPWKIEIHYYMDGVEYTAQDMAGKSGDMRMTISVAKNEACEGNFFDDFALQTTVSFDTESCKNISSIGATIANVGSKKQLTFTILPGKGAEIEITAKAENFAMSEISLNGIKLKLNIEIDDAVIQETISMISDTVKKLDEGAQELKDGTQTLYDGTVSFGSGVKALKNGTKALKDGLGEIQKNSQTLLDGAMTAYEGIVSAAQDGLNEVLLENGLPTISMTVANYATVLSDLLATFTKENFYPTAYQIARDRVMEMVKESEDELYQGYIEENADTIYRTYLENNADMIYEQVVIDTMREEFSKILPESMVEQSIQDAIAKGVVAEKVEGLTKDQKEQIIDGAMKALTEDQKSLIRQGALGSLTKEQKQQICDGYVDMLMETDWIQLELENGIAEAIEAANKRVNDLMAQLDAYGEFYDGLGQYTGAVDSAVDGAKDLDDGAKELLDGAIELENGAKVLLDGMVEMKDGTEEFASKTDSIDTVVEDMIDAMLTASVGSDRALSSFVSDQNTEVNAVQFVMKTEAIHAPTVVPSIAVEEEKLNFWQKLLRLFGLY